MKADKGQKLGFGGTKIFSGLSKNSTLSTVDIFKGFYIKVVGIVVQKKFRLNSAEFLSLVILTTLV